MRYTMTLGLLVLAFVFNQFLTPVYSTSIGKSPYPQLDPEFTGAGIVNLSNGFYDLAVSTIVVRDNGKVVAISRAIQGGSPATPIWQRLPDGSPDTAFGDGGFLTLTISDTTFYPTNLLLDSAGLVVVSGYIHPNKPQAVLVRLLENGTLDPAFGDAGVLLLPSTYATPEGLVSQPNNRYVLLTQDSATSEILLKRVLSDGTPDPDFGIQGEVRFTDTTPLYYFSLTYSADGLLVGDTTRLSDYDAFRVRRFHLSDGASDTTFGDNGTRLIPFSFHATLGSITVAPNGSLFLLGTLGISGTPLPRLPMARLTSEGDLDATFDTDGTAEIDVIQPEDSGLHGVAAHIDSAQRITIFANYDGFLVAYPFWFRLLSDGQVDTTFGTNGLVRDLPHGLTFAGSFQTLPEGGFLVGGTRFSAAMMKITEDGLPDPPFGDIGYFPIAQPDVDASATGTQVVLLSDGSFVALAQPSPNSGEPQIRLVHFLPDGSLDLAYGDDGMTVLPGNGYRYSQMATDSTHRTYLVGTNGGARLTRLTATGTVDSTFGENGDVLYGVPNRSSGVTLAVDQNDRIITVGRLSYDKPTPDDLTIHRLLPSGTLDSTFGTNGVVTIANCSASVFGDSYDTEIAIAPDGTIVVAAICENLTPDYVLFRFTAGGTPDSTFGTNGRVDFDNFLEISDLLIQPDGKPIILGTHFATPTERAWRLFRLTNEGQPDTTFGTNGIVSHIIPGTASGTSSSARAFALQADGKLVIVGHIDRPSLPTTAHSLRLLPDGTPDPLFGTDGYADLSLTSVDHLADIFIQGDRAVMVGDTHPLPNFSYPTFTIHRYLLGEIVVPSTPTVTASITATALPSPTATPTAVPPGEQLLYLPSIRR